jgi:hypothetical protein
MGTVFFILIMKILKKGGFFQIVQKWKLNYKQKAFTKIIKKDFYLELSHQIIGMDRRA